MRYVRAIHKATGQVTEKFSADGVTEQTRDAMKRDYVFCCPDPQCLQRYDWVKPYKQQRRAASQAPEDRSSEVKIPAHFRENPQTRHNPDCRWDLKEKAQRHKSVARIDDAGLLRLQIDLGARSQSYINEQRRSGSPARILPPQKPGARPAFLESTARKQTKLTSLGTLVALLEREFGHLADPALSMVCLENEKSAVRLWEDIFIGPQSYGRLLKTTDTHIVLVRHPMLIARYPDGRASYQCESLEAPSGDGSVFRVCPVVHVDAAGAAALQRGSVFALAAKPRLMTEYLPFSRHGLFAHYVELPVVARNRISPAKVVSWLSDPQAVQDRSPENLAIPVSNGHHQPEAI